MTNELKRTEYVMHVGNMYLNNLGVELWRTNNDNFWYLRAVTHRSGGGVYRDANKRTAEDFISKEQYDKRIEDNINSIELQRALKFLGL